MESRGRSALDIAAWDILGNASHQPLYQMLGGKMRERIPIYNICVGTKYTKKPSRTEHVSDATDSGKHGRYEDFDAFVEHADEVALELVEEGYRGMKIWPFDVFSLPTGGHYISPEDLKKGLEPFEKIRAAVGDKIEIMVELHSRWDLLVAKQLAVALEPYRPFWYEDPIPIYNMEALHEFSHTTRIPPTVSETVGGLYSYREICAAKAVDILIFDPPLGSAG